jgi:uncharacterized protein
MNHLESTFRGKNNFWRYLVMITAVFLISNTIGSIPLLISYLLKSSSDPQAISNIAGLNSNSLLAMMLFPFIAGLAAFVFLVRPLHSRSFTGIINGTSRIRWNRFFISMLIWYFLSAVYFVFYLKMAPENFSVANTGRIVVILAIISVIMIPFQASLEEIIFRGYLMQGFALVVKNRWFPLAATSIFFALLHTLNPEVKEYGFLTMMPQYLVFGLIFGIITIMDDGVEAAMGAHTANNTFLCITVTNKSSALQTPALYEQTKIYPWAELGVLIIVGIIFIVILKLIFRWGSFSVLSEKIVPPSTSESVN